MQGLKKMERKMKKGRKITIFGHRGAMWEAPENTLVGFEYAFQNAGVKNFEFDIHLTKDRELVVIHDSTVDRTTNGRGNVRAFTLRDLKALNACAFFPWFNQATIPTLEEVLSEYAHKIELFQIEIKPSSRMILKPLVKKLLLIIERFQIKQKVTITSFHPIALQMVKTESSEMSCGLISYHFVPDTLKTAERIGCTVVCIPLKSGNREMVQKAHEMGFLVTGWLGNTAKDIDTLLEWGIDEITTNHPSFAIPYLNSTQKAVYG